MDMVGGEGPLRRRTAKNAEAAAATGPQVPSRRCSSSTKRKALGKETVAAASGRTPRHPRTTPSKSKEDETAVAGADVTEPTKS